MYVKEAIRNVQNWLELHKWARLKSKAPSVLPSGYRPEIDASELCRSKLAHYYQQQIGVLRWTVELGRVNINEEVSMLASYTAAPRVGHFNAMLHILTFLEHHPRSKLVFDDEYPESEAAHDEDWSEFHLNAKEEIPPNAHKALGETVTLVCFCDSDHAGDTISQRSRSALHTNLKNWW
jgi:hypothetical protein